MPLIPAPVEDREIALAPAAPVEERVLVAFKLVPAPVEEREVALVPAAPVEERILVAMKLIPAPVEDRVATPVARAPEAVVVAKVEERRAEPAFAPVQVASVSSFPVIVIDTPARIAPDIARAQQPAAIKVSTEAAPKKQLQFITDRRGGLFFM
jgi:hypothetical protein